MKRGRGEKERTKERAREEERKREIELERGEGRRNGDECNVDKQNRDTFFVAIFPHER